MKVADVAVRPQATHHVDHGPARTVLRRGRGSARGSETRYQWASRAYAALDRVLARSSDQAMVVTHGGTATYLIAAWIGPPTESAGYVKFAASPGSEGVAGTR